MATSSVTDIMQVGIYYLDKEHLVNDNFNGWDAGVLQKAAVDKLLTTVIILFYL